MLALLAMLTLIVELQWLNHAPISRVAEVFYGDQVTKYTWLNIDSIAVVHMIVFLILFVIESGIHAGHFTPPNKIE